jgi:hypothetical protein
MATIPAVRSSIQHNIEKVTWETLTDADTATAVIPMGVGSLAGSVQVIGTFGGCTVTIQGSNDNSNWATLKDLYGANLSFTAAGIADFSTAVGYVRPIVTGGTAEDIDVIVVFRN